MMTSMLPILTTPNTTMNSAANGSSVSLRAPLPFDLSAEEGLALLGNLKREQKEVEESIKQVLAFLDGEEAAGRLDALSYEPGIYEVEGVRLTRASRTSWSYSPAVKALQQAEQDNGQAEVKQTTYWLAKLL